VLEALAFPKGGGRPLKFYGKEEACQRWLEEQRELGFNPGRNMRRAYTHKALNALLQGSAADLMKKCMVDIWDAGIFELIIPHLTVHDELDVSVPRTSEGAEAFKELVNMMSTSMKLKVPVFASASTGKNWAEAKGND
jgi:DNA polymerase I-like protein with 3'-5' exonuclease and polymerase domains